MTTITATDYSAIMACPDCASEVTVTAGQRTRIRVVHAAGCPWRVRYLAGEAYGRIPCGTVVTHRGPYKRKAAAL